jgi:hypothetical protein
VELLVRIAQLEETELTSARNAFDAWLEILRLDPTHERARIEIEADLRILCCVFLAAAKLAFSRLARGINLLGSLFAERANLSGTLFEEKAHFPATTFLRGVRFYEARLECETRFNETVFNGPICFEHTRFAEALDLSKSILYGVTWMDIKGMRVAGRTALSGDVKIDFEQIRGRILGELGERLSSPEDDSRPAKPKERIESLRYAADQYSTLAGNFAASTGPGSWRASDYCHSRYLDLYRQISWLCGDYWTWLKSLTFKIVLGNGIYVKFPFAAALCVILGFGLFYALAAGDLIRTDYNVTPLAPVTLSPAPVTLSPAPVTLSPAPAAQAPLAGTATAGAGTRRIVCLADMKPWHNRLATAVYYSVITFATVGYGDWHPVGWARLLASAEALSGVTLMAAFTVILVRKIIR